MKKQFLEIVNEVKSTGIKEKIAAAGLSHGYRQRKPGVAAEISPSKHTYQRPHQDKQSPHAGIVRVIIDKGIDDEDHGKAHQEKSTLPSQCKKRR